MFKLSDFSKSNEEKTNLDNDTGNLKINSNSFLGTIWETAKGYARFKFAKTLLFGAFLAIFLIATGDFHRSKFMADDASTKGANDDYFGLGAFVADALGWKSTLSNIHPVFKTLGIKKLEAKYKVEFGRDIKYSKILRYAEYQGEDYLVMAREARGSENKKLILHYSTLFGMSASDFCDDFFDGFIPSEKMRKHFVGYIRINKIKDELTKENDDGKKLFRCVMPPDVIEEYLEDDREDD